MRLFLWFSNTVLQTSTGEGRRFNNLKAARVASRRGAIWKSDCDTFSAASVFSNSLFHCHYHQNRHGKQIYQFIFNISQKEEEATSLVGQNSTLVLRENDSGSLSCHDVFGTLHCQTLSSRLKAEPDIKRDLPTNAKVRDGRREQRHIAVVASEPFKTFVSERDFGNGPVAKTRIKSFKRSFERAGSYQKAIPPKIFRLICPSENRFVLFKSWYFIPSP